MTAPALGLETPEQKAARLAAEQKANTLTLTAEDNFKLTALWEIVQTRLVRRNVPTENLTRGTVLPASAGTVVHAWRGGAAI